MTTPTPPRTNEEIVEAASQLFVVAPNEADMVSAIALSSVRLAFAEAARMVVEPRMWNSPDDFAAALRARAKEGA